MSRSLDSIGTIHRYLLVLILTVTVTYGRMVGGSEETICPVPCHCVFEQFMANCSTLGLYTMPQTDATNESFGWIESMDFRGNYLGEIDSETLASFPGLLELSLMDNRIHDISNGSFSHLAPMLHRLVLSGNRLTVVPPAIRDLFTLRELDLSRNAIWSLGRDTFKGLDELEMLYLDHNRLYAFDGAAFHGLPSLQMLSMTENLIAEDPVGWFVNCSQLHALYLSHNAVPLVSEVRTWFGAVDTAPLEILFLTNNDIKSLEGMLRGMVHLKQLDVGSNQISRIGKESMEGLFQLTDLIINTNSLEYVDEESFKNMSHLQVLKIYENQLESLPSGLFSQTKRLTTLHAAQNNLVDISAITDEHLEELTDLYIFSNSIPDIGGRGFTGLPGLTTLLAGGNQMTRIPNVTHLPWLDILELSKNKIQSIPVGAFQGSMNIRQIYLEHNQLEKMDYDPVAHLYGLEKFSLGDNPWYCDCRIEWMLDVIFSEYPPPWADDIVNDIYCENPPQLRPLSLIRISDEGIVLPCPTLPDRNVIISLFVLWFGVVFTCTARYWFRKFAKSYKRKNLGRRNSKYQKRLSRKRRNGLIFNHIGGFRPTFRGSDSYELIVRDTDKEQNSGSRGKRTNGNLKLNRIEVARVTTV